MKTSLIRVKPHCYDLARLVDRANRSSKSQRALNKTPAIQTKLAEP